MESVSVRYKSNSSSKIDSSPVKGSSSRRYTTRRAILPPVRVMKRLEKIAYPASSANSPTSNPIYFLLLYFIWLTTWYTLTLPHFTEALITPNLTVKRLCHENSKPMTVLTE